MTDLLNHPSLVLLNFLVTHFLFKLLILQLKRFAHLSEQLGPRFQLKVFVLVANFASITEVDSVKRHIQEATHIVELNDSRIINGTRCAIDDRLSKRQSILKNKVIGKGKSEISLVFDSDY